MDAAGEKAERKKIRVQIINVWLIIKGQAEK
jgi:hypothetical protein